jgi:PhnB protein
MTDAIPERAAMQVSPYLSFNGQCELAFKLYERVFGGQRGPIFRYGGSPMEDQAPAGWQDKIMHGSIDVGSLVLMGADVVPASYEEPKGFSLSVHTSDVSEAERIFRDLSEGGRTVMPLERTFWAARFGMLIDRFGIPWTINCEEPEQAGPGA